MSTRMLSDFLHRIAREREADARGARRRPVGALLRYAVLGAVALSILPASAAASLPAHAPQDGAKSQGGVGPKQSAEQTQREEAGRKDVHVKLPPKIDTRPFKDLLLKGKELYDRGELDLSRTVELTVEADRNEDGTLANVALTGSAAGDPALKELTADAVAALSESRVFSVLEGPGRVRMGLLLDGQRFRAVLVAELDTVQRAEQTANVYGLGITAMRFKKSGTDEGQVWKNMTASASGKQLALKLEMTRAEAGNLLLKQITPN